VYRETHGPRSIHALHYPYEGLVLEVVEAASDRGALEQWLRDEYLPVRLAGSQVAMTLLFEPSSFNGEMPDPNAPEKCVIFKDPPGIERLVTMLSFSEVRPPEGWEDVFASAGDAIAASGNGRTVFAAPFYPTLPGTDTYVDQLR
jgi:hypothetical protein